jgi:hypothetical protein
VTELEKLDQHYVNIKHHFPIGINGYSCRYRFTCNAKRNFSALKCIENKRKTERKKEREREREKKVR